MSENELNQAREELRAIRATKPLAKPSIGLDELSNALREHIRYEHGMGEKSRAQQLTHIRDQLSTFRAAYEAHK
jgi:hypothetical protein